MKLYDLGQVSWLDSQIFYHTLPRVGREGLVVCQPGSPYVSIGFHQDLFTEVDLDYCMKNKIPVFKREVGGGTVYLDQNQIFFQLVLHKKNPLVPLDRSKFYQKFLQPAIRTLHSLNIPAQFRPHCDIVVNRRKISGNGAGEIGDYVVFAGNLLFDFDFQTMANVLMVPNENLRHLLLEQMQSNLTTISRELNHKPDRDLIKDRLISSFTELFENLPAGVPDELCLQEAAALKLKHTSKEWLTEPGRKLPYREVKIAEGIYVRSADLALQGLPVNVTLVLKAEIIDQIELAGQDQSLSGLRVLENILKGRKGHKEELITVLNSIKKAMNLNFSTGEVSEFAKILALRA